MNNLPKIYYINLKKSLDRNNYMINQFKQYKISNYERVDAEDILNYKNLSFLNGELPKGIRPVEAIVTFSHLKAIKKFIDSEEDWAIIVEDDVDFSTSKYWNFSWEEIFKLLPKNLSILQMTLSTRKNKDINFHLHIRSFWDFNATAYLINKNYAKKIFNLYIVDDKLDMSFNKKMNKYDKDNKDTFLQQSYATVEEMIYGLDKETIYSLPIFCYTMEYESLQNPDHYDQTLNSRDRIIKYWKEQHKNFTLEDILQP